MFNSYRFCLTVLTSNLILILSPLGFSRNAHLFLSPTQNTVVLVIIIIIIRMINNYTEQKKQHYPTSRIKHGTSSGNAKSSTARSDNCFCISIIRELHNQTRITVF